WTSCPEMSVPAMTAWPAGPDTGLACNGTGTARVPAAIATISRALGAQCRALRAKANGRVIAHLRGSAFGDRRQRDVPVASRTPMPECWHRDLAEICRGLERGLHAAIKRGFIRPAEKRRRCPHGGWYPAVRIPTLSPGRRPAVTCRTPCGQWRFPQGG